MEGVNLTSTVVETLREKIIAGELKAGHKLNEINISMDLGVSRPPLREAFRVPPQSEMDFRTA